MKSKRRLTAMLLAGCLAVSSVPVAFAEDAPEQTTLTPEQQQEQVFALADQAREDSKAAAPTEGTCGENASWKLENGTLTISGTGEMKDYSNANNKYEPWYESRSSITKVVVEDGITSLGKYAFYQCSNLTQVSLPDSLESIGEYAFYGCSGLKELRIPDHVNVIKGHAFTSCSSLLQIDIPNGITEISKGTFESCSSLKYVMIPNSVVTIDGDAFNGCSALKSVTIPDSVVRIESAAFAYCKSLAAVAIPNSVGNIGSSAFRNCTNVKEVELADSVVNLGEWAFTECTSLKSIRLSEQLSAIRDDTFNGCKSLTDVTVPDSVATIEENAFRNSGLKRITLGTGVTTIQSDAFRNSGLSEIYFTGDAPFIDSDGFYIITATAYYPRNASGWEDVIQKQYGGTITWTPWIPGEKPETRQFQIDRDAWGFTNSTSTFGDAKEGYYITQADYDRLVSLLPNTEREYILTAVETKKIPLSNVEILQCESTYNIDGKTLNHMKWGGSCHGMSVWACLTKDGVRKIAELGSAAENLHSVAFSPKVESAINYYHMQQCLQNTVLATNRFKSLPQNEQLKQLENQVSDNQVALVSFNWYTKFDKDGKPKNTSGSSHTVVGYGTESGSWNKTVNDRTDTYTHRILIYDCNRGEYDEEYDLYYNDSGLWCIPAYNIRSASNEINGMGDNGCLNLVSNDKKVLNPVSYAQDSTKLYVTENSQTVLATSSDNTYSVNWGSGSADIDGIIASNVSGTERVNVIMEANVTEDGTSEECRASAVLPNAKEYTIKSSEDGMSYQLKNENYLTVAASEKSGTMKIQADGGAKIDTQEAGDYYISMTANEGYHELPWSTVEVAGEDCKQISADMTDEGIVVSGDNLKDITIIGKKDEQTQEVTVSTDKSDVLISSDNGDISVKQDSDGDGKYETDIVKPTPDPKPTTPVTEVFSDIQPSAWYVDCVQFVYDNGLMTGTSKTTFEPGTTLNRAMVAQVLYNYDKRVDSPYRATNGIQFKDVSKNDWYYEAIQWASANGIASGVGNGYFEPNKPVTREQVAQFLYNYNGRPNVSGNLPFSDANQVSGWAKNAMLWAYQNNIINGTTSPDGGLLLDPQGSATRAQAAAILMNYMKNMM